MELACPACSVKHRTEDHPGAFEIQCVCGYSILMPDEAALAASSQILANHTPAPDFANAGGPVGGLSSSVPAAFEAEDAGIALPPAETPPVAATPVADFGMTPPEQLPEGMIYDPFELPTSNIVPTETPPAEPVSPDFTAGAEDAPTAPIAVAPPAPAPSAKAPAADGPAKRLVDRVQAASMGRLLGANFKIKCEGLARDRLVEISRRAIKLAKTRPWLENEIRGRGIELENLPDAPELAHVPETIALEIYLACFELGGRCTIERESP